MRHPTEPASDLRQFASVLWLPDDEPPQPPKPPPPVSRFTAPCPACQRPVEWTQRHGTVSGEGAYVYDIACRCDDGGAA